MKMYIESDNGGRAIAIEFNRVWYFVDCAPYGTWGDIDILEGTEEAAAERIRRGIKNGACYGLADCISDIEAGDMLYNHISEYDGMTVDDILKKENSDRDFDLIKFVEI